MNDSCPSHARFFKLGLTGYPLGHSLSPQIHAAALAACGLSGEYSLFPIPPEDLQSLQDLLRRVKVQEIVGLNATIPHKQTLVEQMDELTLAAQAIGAVNTIYLRDEKIIGDNTDADGFLSDLKKVTGEQNIELGKSALILGAGGSARAVLYALLRDGWRVSLVARRLEQARRLADSFSNERLSVVYLPDLQPAPFDLIVNATPLGMTPHTDASPLTNADFFHPKLFVYDLVYNPQETRLVCEARAHGASAVSGLGMLIEQAALAFALWTGCHPSREILRDAIHFPS